ncbi:hypothetical protein KKB40_05515 [Patescibacteria group bacterium]|nr:hypothetical protein [Patescibacteria group bacterium]
MTTKWIGKNKIFLIVVFVITTIAGLYVINGNRYYLQSNGNYTYKIDRWTGKTWTVTPYGEKEVQQAIEKEEAVSFPISNLIVENAKGKSGDYCIRMSGTITNNYKLPATNISLRVDFSSEKGGKPFYYEVFFPFSSTNEQVQPGSTKSFDKCMNNNTEATLKDTQWWFSITPYSADVFE